jgi:hypothetical protein
LAFQGWYAPEFVNSITTKRTKDSCAPWATLAIDQIKVSRKQVNSHAQAELLSSERRGILHPIFTSRLSFHHPTINTSPLRGLLPSQHVHLPFLLSHEAVGASVTDLLRHAHQPEPSLRGKGWCEAAVPLNMAFPGRVPKYLAVSPSFERSSIKQGGAGVRIKRPSSLSALCLRGGRNRQANKRIKQGKQKVARTPSIPRDKHIAPHHHII